MWSRERAQSDKLQNTMSYDEHEENSEQLMDVNQQFENKLLNCRTVSKLYDDWRVVVMGIK